VEEMDNNGGFDPKPPNNLRFTTCITKDERKTQRSEDSKPAESIKYDENATRERTLDNVDFDMDDQLVGDILLFLEEFERHLRMKERDEKDPLGLETPVELPVDIVRWRESVSN
jgi:hypothetical protein